MNCEQKSGINLYFYLLVPFVALLFLFIASCWNNGNTLTTGLSYPNLSYLLTVTQHCLGAQVGSEVTKSGEMTGLVWKLSLPMEATTLTVFRACMFWQTEVDANTLEFLSRIKKKSRQIFV